MKTHTLYGECPSCGAMCQPQLAGAAFTPDEDGIIEEYVVCCDCEIVWSLYNDHWDADETDHSHEYRIDNIETFAKWGKPYECK